MTACCNAREALGWNRSALPKVRSVTMGNAASARRAAQLYAVSRNGTTAGGRGGFGSGARRKPKRKRRYVRLLVLAGRVSTHVRFPASLPVTATTTLFAQLGKS